MCNMNKNNLLTLFFHEGTPSEEREIQKHVDNCQECRDYLLTLDRTDRTLHTLKDRAPLPDTFDTILANLPRKQVQPVPAAVKQAKTEKSTVPVKHILMILCAIFAILTGISFVHHKITLLPYWETLSEWGPVQALGTFGATTVVFFLLGIVVTLALTPVLILDLQQKRYRYGFN
ncbi:MAG: hypothetical protein GY950_28505 [bacterium]|nr:hypothetical protein [bacterium]